jgi:hypothetical protein
MKNICIITNDDPLKQPRVLRQLKYFTSLNNQFCIFLVSNSKVKEYSVINYELDRFSFLKNFIRILLFLKTKNYENYFWTKKNKDLAKNLLKVKFDLIIVHGIRNILLGQKIARGAKILFDAHEYYPENFSDNFLWNFTFKGYYKYLCEKYLEKVDYVITVSPGILEEYKKNFNIKDIELITNATYYKNLEPSKVNKDHIKLIHHGDCSSSRKLELMIEAARYFNKNIHLYLMLVVSKSYKLYYKKLLKMAEKVNNVHFIEPVPTDKIVDKINSFDIGLVFIPPTNLNLKYVLANKFFEFIQARLMLITGPSIELVKYIDKYNLGKYTTSFEPKELAKLINNLTANEIEKYKNNVNSCAFELSDEQENYSKLDTIFRKLLNN